MDSFTPVTWPTASRVTFYKVPWDAAYKDVVRFASAEERDAYFDGLASDSIELDKLTYLKPNQPIKIPIPYSKAYTYNYCVVENPTLPVPGEVTPPVLYYFVTSVAFTAPNTSYMELQLDVFQTYHFNVCFGRSFVERGHVAMQAELNTVTDRGGTVEPWVLRRYLTAAESLDIGGEYLVCDTQHNDVSYKDGSGDDGYWGIIMSTVDLESDWGSITDPNLKTATGQIADGIAGGCNVYMVSSSALVSLMNVLKDSSWVSKGIISITLFPKRLLSPGDAVSIGGVDGYKLGDSQTNVLFANINGTANRIMSGIALRYRNLHKFLTYPYSVIELNNYNGSPVLLKPDLMNTDDMTLEAKACAVPPFIRLGIYPWNYGASESNAPFHYMYQNMDGNNHDATIFMGAFLDVAVWFSDWPQLSIVNDAYISYLASNARTLLYNYNTAGWTLSKQQRATDLTYDQTMATLANNQNNQDLKNIAGVAHTAMNGVSALAGGNALGALTGTLGSGIDLVAGNMQFQNNQDLAYGIASQNASLARFTAKGDYENAISGMVAAVQDASLLAPSVVGQSGGDGFALKNGLIGVTTKYKTVDACHQHIIGEYWLRYGYAVREFMPIPQNLKCMTKFTYWKMSETYLTCANADEGAKDVIRGIFEKGVTVWSNPADIGNIDLADNEPLPGIPY